MDIRENVNLLKSHVGRWSTEVEYEFEGVKLEISSTDLARDSFSHAPGTLTIQLRRAR